MAAKDLGNKFTCFKCGSKFYDLKRPEPVCPKCGADQRESPVVRSPEKTERKRAAKAAVVEEVAEPAEEVAEDAAGEDDEEAEPEEVASEDDDRDL